MTYTDRIRGDVTPVYDPPVYVTPYLAGQLRTCSSQPGFCLSTMISDFSIHQLWSRDPSLCGLWSVICQLWPTTTRGALKIVKFAIAPIPICTKNYFQLGKTRKVNKWQFQYFCDPWWKIFDQWSMMCDLWPKKIQQGYMIWRFKPPLWPDNHKIWDSWKRFGCRKCCQHWFGTKMVSSTKDLFSFRSYIYHMTKMDRIHIFENGPDLYAVCKSRVFVLERNLYFTAVEFIS